MSRAVASCWPLSGLHGVMAWPVFPGIICYFSFCSDLCHTDTHSHTCAQPLRTAEGWSRPQLSLPDNRWTKGTRRGECQAGDGGGLSGGGVKGDSWWTLITDERVLLGVEVGGLGWPWPLWGGQMGCEGHRPRGGEREEGIKAVTPPVLFKPAVINDKTHKRTRHASWPLPALCWSSGTGVFGVVTFPTLLIDEPFLSHHKLW